MLYSLDMHCEKPTLNITYVPSGEAGESNSTHMTKHTKYHSSNSCDIPEYILGDIGNYTDGELASSGRRIIYKNKKYSSRYVGYYATQGADFYLEGYCPEAANHTVLVGFAKNKAKATDPPNNVTRLFCTPFYYQQKVLATIDSKTKAPYLISSEHEKQKLPDIKWNTSFFEQQMNRGASTAAARGSFPLGFWPDVLERMSTTELSPLDSGTFIQDMVGLTVGASKRPLDELLDEEALGKAYEASYRVIFARSMVEILDSTFSNTTATKGQIQYINGAVAIVPAFAYVVQGLLGFISVCAIALMVVSSRRTWKLHSDPATIASFMSMVAHNQTLLEKFGRLDCVEKKDFEGWTKERKFRLESNVDGIV